MSYAASHSPLNFSRPDEFIPERWLATKMQDTDSKHDAAGSDLQGDRLEASQPFSLGPRSCIGLSMAYFELRLVLARMLWTFDLSLPGGPGSGLLWAEQKTYATWLKEPSEVRLRERAMS